MRFLLILCSLFLLPNLFAQMPLRTIHSNTDETYMLEGDDPQPREWYLVPEAKLDVYELDKSKGPVSVSFFTDLDSLVVELRPGESYDFVVVLNGKDSCFTR